MVEKFIQLFFTQKELTTSVNLNHRHLKITSLGPWTTKFWRRNCFTNRSFSRIRRFPMFWVLEFQLLLTETTSDLASAAKFRNSIRTEIFSSFAPKITDSLFLRKKPIKWSTSFWNRHLCPLIQHRPTLKAKTNDVPSF